MKIRKATKDDLDLMQSFFAAARKYMRESGNPTQWKDNRPPLFLIEKDLNNKTSYIIEDDNNNPVATFSFTIGIEPTYVKIYDGKWLNDKPYGTIHRIASNQETKGVFAFVMEFLKTFEIDIRIDTHHDNQKMLYLLNKYGFIRCGNIIIDDGTSRIAFQKIYTK